MRLHAKYALPLLLALAAGSLGPRFEVPHAEARVEDARPKRGVGFLSLEEFRDLAEELAPRVNLFAETWSQNRAAEFYGGTTRDYLYWLKGEFRRARSRADALAIRDRLRKQRSIDVRDFIAPMSDIDIVSNKDVELDAERFGVRKIDLRDGDIFNPRTEAGQNELLQGFVPAEKIRLRGGKFVPTSQFGDGLAEVYSGRLTVRFAKPEDFARSHYAQQGLNHPILLALRYLRLVAVNHYQEHGRGYPRMSELMDIDPTSRKAVEEIIKKALDGRELRAFLKKPQSRKWLNGSIQKTFRSNTSPTAGMALMKQFGVDRLIRTYGLEPINQFLFAKAPNPDQAAANIKKYGAKIDKLYEPATKHFEDGFLYHGTKGYDRLRDILLLGILPSEQGSGGAGLYGVSQAFQHFAEGWADVPENLVRFKVDPQARLIDITQGEGKRVWEKFVAGAKPTAKLHEEFAAAFDAPILRYDYGKTRAYVIGDSTVLSSPEGVYREVLTLSKAMERAEKLRTWPEVLRLVESVPLSGFNTAELDSIAEALASSPAVARSKELSPKMLSDAMALLIDLKKDQFEVIARDGGRARPAVRRLATHREIPENILQLITQAIVRDEVVLNEESGRVLGRILADHAPRAMLPVLDLKTIAAAQEATEREALVASFIEALNATKTSTPELQPAISALILETHEEAVDHAAIRYLARVDRLSDQDEAKLARVLGSKVHAQVSEQAIQETVELFAKHVARDPGITERIARLDSRKVMLMDDLQSRALANQTHFTPGASEATLRNIPPEEYLPFFDRLQITPAQLQRAVERAAYFSETRPSNLYAGYWQDNPRFLSALKVAKAGNCRTADCIFPLFVVMDALTDTQLKKFRAQLPRLADRAELEKAASRRLTARDPSVRVAYWVLDGGVAKDPKVLNAAARTLEKYGSSSDGEWARRRLEKLTGGARDCGKGFAKLAGARVQARR